MAQLSWLSAEDRGEVNEFDMVERSVAEGFETTTLKQPQQRPTSTTAVTISEVSKYKEQERVITMEHQARMEALASSEPPARPPHETMEDEDAVKARIAQLTAELRTVRQRTALAQVTLQNKTQTGHLTVKRVQRRLADAKRTLDAKRVIHNDNIMAIQEHRTRARRDTVPVELQGGAPPATEPTQGSGDRHGSVPFSTPEALAARIDELLEIHCLGPPVAVKEANGRVGSRFASGARTVRFANGTEKTVLPDESEVVKFYNGDLKHASGGTQVYLYADVQTLLTTLPDKTEIYRFESGQIERHLQDGRVDIEYPDGAKKTVSK